VFLWAFIGLESATVTAEEAVRAARGEHKPVAVGAHR